MDTVIQTIINVIILAVVYILMGMGFAFILNLLGIFNLAHGAIFMASSYGCYLLVTKAGLPGFVAFPLTVLVAAALGVVVERFLFRPFGGDFNRTMMVAIALSTILVTSFNLLMGTKVVAIPAFIEGTTGRPPFAVQSDRILAFCIGVVILVAIIVFVGRSRRGAQMMAVTQNRQGAALQGIRFSQVAAIACSVGFGLAAIAGVFMGTLYNLDPFMGDKTLIKVLMLVILAGVGSFRGIFIVGGLLGVLYGALPMVLPGAVVDAVASILVLALLITRPQGFFGHEEAQQPTPELGDSVHERESSEAKTRRRRWAGPSAVGVVIIVLALLPLALSGSYYLHITILAMVYVVVSSSFRAISISGQFNIAQGAYMGIGAYAAALPSVWLHWPPYVTLPLGAVAATIVGTLLAYPFARLRTIYYAMGTLFLGYVVINLFTVGGKWTGSNSGLAGVHPIFTNRTYYYYMFLGLMLFSLICLYRFEFSRMGVTLKAVAQSHQVAASVGISERRSRMLAVAFGCFFTGLVGAGYAHYQMVASQSSFGLSATLWIIMYVLVGGINSFWGPTIGVFILMFIPEFFRDLKGWLPYVSAGILLLIAFTLPEGVVGIPKLIRARVFARAAAKKEVSGDAS
jgi:branched-chain amino acid transport system permease protein